ncbi:MAG: hypothetical protein K2X32_03420 [Phycisphaerales bacterium]|nr:hypothetical protein [Phycisphaerales bacterium]
MRDNSRSSLALGFILVAMGQDDADRPQGRGDSSADRPLWRSADFLLWGGTVIELFVVAIMLMLAATGIGDSRLMLGALAIGGAAGVSLLAGLLAREYLQRLLDLSGTGDLIINWAMQVGLPVLAGTLYFAGWFGVATGLIGLMTLLTVGLAGLLACSERFREAMLSPPTEDERPE